MPARLIVALGLAGALLLAACGSPAQHPAAPTSSAKAVHTTVAASPTRTPSTTPAKPAEPAGQFSIAFAGDVHFAGRTASRLASPATAFGSSAAVLANADLTMVNLETAIAVGGQPEQKSFTFQAPPSALTALADAGVDVATMANNHGADYGLAGLHQTLTAISRSGFPVIGIGANAAAAYAPFYRTVNGVRVAIVAASQVQDETLAHFSATDTSPGIANA
ncbi:MAG TPA: CapA family protein, partial [Jatrophihabitans sp.]|nr:CapA family protein [Jatrophihabitans sp.]